MNGESKKYLSPNRKIEESNMTIEELSIPRNAETKVGDGPVLVLSPHPDDEVFGCGGAILNHVRSRDSVYVVILTNGNNQAITFSRKKEEYIKTRQRESLQAARILGYGKPTFWNLSDQGLVYGEELIQKIMDQIKNLQVNLVYAPSIEEMHPDHRNLGMMAIEAIRRLEGNLLLAMYEVGSTLRPNFILDISDIFHIKQKAMECFVSQLQIHNYIKQIKSLNYFRTYNLSNKVQAAEAYFVKFSNQIKENVFSIYFYHRQWLEKINQNFDLQKNPLVSIIVRTLGRPILKEALESIALQTYPNIEVVLVNASGDQIEKREIWSGRYPIRICSEDIQLPRSKAANLGLANVKGEFITFLDEDDVIYPDHIEKLVRALQKYSNIKVAYSGSQIEYRERNGKLLSKNELNEPFEIKRLQVENYIPNHSVLFNRSLLELNCSFDEELDRYEDWDFLLKLSRHTDFVHVPFVTACYRNYGESGFGYFSDNALIEKNRSIFFDKWRKIWSGKELNAVMEYMKHDSPWISALKGEISSMQSDLSSKEKQLIDIEKQIINRDAQIKKKDKKIEENKNYIYKLQKQIKHLNTIVQEKDNQISELFNSNSWKITAPFRLFKTKLMNMNIFLIATRRLIRDRGGGLKGTLELIKTMITICKSEGINVVLSRALFHLRLNNAHQSLPIQKPVRFKKTNKVIPHLSSVDIIVCVHNALEDTQKCLDSIVSHTSNPYQLILIDDGSNDSTKKFLKEFAESQGTSLHRNEKPLGYTFAANQGLRLSRSDYIILLNSDTIVTPEWLDRMIMCAESNTNIGLVGPLSNQASWQSIPDFESNGDWAENNLPEDIDVNDMAALVAQYSGRFYPEIPFLNGFCLLVKRGVLEDLGYFDEENFGSGYGEENDYCLRARIKGWKLALADDVYIYHAHSKSYSDERRKQLYRKAEAGLEKKHDLRLINEGVKLCRSDSVLESIRARSRHMITRNNLLKEGRKLWQGKSVLFILPVTDAGGGSNIVINEANALMNMGINVQLLNFEVYKQDFLFAYPELDLPVIYVHSQDDIPQVGKEFDSVIATFNPTVYWLAPLAKERENKPIIGYYIQDFEPYFYPQNSYEYQRAFQSYTYLPQMKLFCKTSWNQELIKSKTGQDCSIIGPSFNIDLFRPEPRKENSWPYRSLRIVAMIRPSSPRRSPKLTMEILGEVKKKFGEEIEIILFGENEQDPQFKALPNKFDYKNLGKQTPEQLAYTFNESDIFVDFSSYQAMGLTGREAMGCGLAVILPETGGVHSYAQNDRNALLIDTKNMNECFKKLEQLIKDEYFRKSLQAQAIHDSAKFYPEAAAFNLMELLFPKELVKENNNISIPCL